MNIYHGRLNRSILTTATVLKIGKTFTFVQTCVGAHFHSACLTQLFITFVYISLGICSSYVL